jgi:hypothetical protein
MTAKTNRQQSTAPGKQEGGHDAPFCRWNLVPLFRKHELVKRDIFIDEGEAWMS